MVGGLGVEPAFLPDFAVDVLFGGGLSLARALTDTGAVTHGQMLRAGALLDVLMVPLTTLLVFLLAGL